MKNMFKIVADGNPTQLEMSRDVLDLAVQVTSHINDNFESSDFFAIRHTEQEEISMFLSFLNEAQNAMQPEDDMVSLALNPEQYRHFENVFIHAHNFMDEDFDEDFETIDYIADVIAPISPTG